MRDWLPGVDLSQRFDDDYRGTRMAVVDKGVLHTTETGPAWPGYGGGRSAPTATARWDFAARRLVVRQHFPLWMSARALRNASGGGETNRDGVYQLELVGTCDPTYRTSRREWGRAGVDYVYWPDAPREALDALAVHMRAVEAATSIPRRSGLRFAPFPASYDVLGMSQAEWRSFTGWCGHMHVIENTHGDPGAIDIDHLITTSEEDDMPTAAEIADAVMSWSAPEYVDEDGNTVRDTRTASDMIWSTHRAAVDEAFGNLVVRRDGKEISALQELADVKTAALAQDAKLAGLTVAVEALAAGRGIDVTAIEMAMRRVLSEETVRVDVSVGHATKEKP